MKTYVLTISRTFPSTHRRKGKPTCFVEKILENESVRPSEDLLKTPEFLNHTRHSYEPKLHTLRGNYPLWRKRFDEIEAGKACLSLRYWSGKPYRSKQIEIARLTKENGIGIVELKFVFRDIKCPWLYSEKIADNDLRNADFRIDTISKNDGLSTGDFQDWFKKYDLSKPMAIIHFTKFRY